MPVERSARWRRLVARFKRSPTRDALRRLERDDRRDATQQEQDDD